MDVNPTEMLRIGDRLNEMLAKAGQPPLSSDLANPFGAYCVLLMGWNARTNLTAIRDEEGILRRHFVESIVCARALPTGIRSLLDFGSGAGFPGLPIAICRPEIAVTLAESRNKKAAFLHEAIRTLGIAVTIHSGRAEALGCSFDCVTLRAVDRMNEAVQNAIALLSPGGWLALLTTTEAGEEAKSIAGPDIAWTHSTILAPGTDRMLLLGNKRTSRYNPRGIK
jgi:16S rRNA (guanine527-N7)-methyltransferase